MENNFTPWNHTYSLKNFGISAYPMPAHTPLLQHIQNKTSILAIYTVFFNPKNNQFHYYYGYKNSTIRHQLHHSLTCFFNQLEPQDLNSMAQLKIRLFSCYPHLKECSLPCFQLIREQHQIIGFSLVIKPFSASIENETELKQLNQLFYEIESHSPQDAYKYLFHTVIDEISDHIYVTDLETDKILYMNETMKRKYQLDDPVGKVCWQVLQKDIKERCAFCPIPELQKMKSGVVTWEEKSTIDHHDYKNRDSLITWIDGRTVHLQQSTDITDFKTISFAANVDELTHLANRRAGKLKLQNILSKGVNEDKNVCLVLIDINGLKQTNDYYGHKEGDTKICSITQVINSLVPSDDLFFRLSGDEFVLAFYDTTPHQVRNKMMFAQQKLTELKEILDIPYDLGFCFGIVSINPNNHYTIDTLLTMADEKMYEQKRSVHLKQNELLIQKGTNMSTATEEFTYNKEALLEALRASMDDYVYVCNMKTGTFNYPQAMVDEFNLPSSVLNNAAAIWGSKIHPLDKAAFLESNQEIIDGKATTHCVDYRAINHNNEWVWLRCRGQVIFDDLGSPDLFAGIISHIGRKDKIDPTTGLFNKFCLEEDIKNHIANSKSPLALIVLDLDNFKAINQLHDRSFGDGVLQQAAQNICEAVPKEAVVYKLDADEFAVVLKSYSILQIETIYRKIKQFFSSQQMYANQRYYCSISGGCAMYPEHTNLYVNLFKYANYALETSKKKGKDQLSFFTDQIINEHLRRLTLIEQLRQSIENDFDTFSLKFQPIVNAQSQKMIGAEALMRWTSPTYGVISPSEFIPLLEESRLIIQAGRWILWEAFMEAKKCIAVNPDFLVFINLSYVQTNPQPIAPYIKKIMQEIQIPPKNIVLEFTESYRASHEISDIYHSLHQLGIKTAMDDFGTGYSSLNILKQCPVDIVKIDKIFVENIADNHFDITLIELIIELCHKVNIQVCLEGVENIDEYTIIKPFSPDFIQGFLFGKPCQGEQLIDLLKQ